MIFTKDYKQVDSMISDVDTGIKYQCS